MKKAFTLVELVISVILLSILMLFLYKSYAQLNLLNKEYHLEVKKLQNKERIKRTFYLDLTEAQKSSVQIIKDKYFYFISFSTINSLHRRIKPYVCYLVKNETLYRLESLKRISSPDIGLDTAFDIDEIGKVEKFKIYTSMVSLGIYLYEIKFKNEPTIFMKVKVLN